MNNEEKILEMLAKQGEMIGQINGRLDNMDGRLDRLETTQAEMKAELAEVHEIATKVAVTQEAVVLPRLDTLAEKEAVEAVAEEQKTLKGAVQMLSRRVAELEKAQ